MLDCRGASRKAFPCFTVASTISLLCLALQAVQLMILGLELEAYQAFGLSSSGSCAKVFRLYCRVGAFMVLGLRRLEVQQKSRIR